MQNAPSQEDVKTLLSDLVKSKTRKRMASILGVTEADISRRFNVNDPRKLSIAEGLREWWALTGADPEAAEVFKAYVCGLYESWVRPGRQESLASLVIAANRESSEVIEAWAANKPLHEQRKETVEAIAALQRHLEGLDSQAALREVRR